VVPGPAHGAGAGDRSVPRLTEWATITFRSTRQGIDAVLGVCPGPLVSRIHAERRGSGNPALAVNP
jgi:hypothetical protein